MRSEPWGLVTTIPTYLTLHILQCDYRGFAHCDVDAEVIYCSALEQTWGFKLVYLEK